MGSKKESLYPSIKLMMSTGIVLLRNDYYKKDRTEMGKNLTFLRKAFCYVKELAIPLKISGDCWSFFSYL